MSPCRNRWTCCVGSAFTVYLVSDGSREFLRVMAATAYGIPPEQVIGFPGQQHDEAEIRWVGGGWEGA